MQTIANHLASGMPDELKIAIARIAERDNVSLEETIVSFLDRGVTTYERFISSYSGK